MKTETKMLGIGMTERNVPKVMSEVNILDVFKIASLVGKSKIQSNSEFEYSTFLIARLVNGIDDLSNSDRCWNWMKSTSTGYGSMTVGGKTKRCHRLMYEIVFGEIESSELFVCHKCDNPLCCNPRHLFLGKQKQNMEDCSAKGRSASKHNNGMSKLTQSDADEIRRLAKTGLQQYKIAEQFSIGQSQVSRVVKGVNW